MVFSVQDKILLILNFLTVLYYLSINDKYEPDDIKNLFNTLIFFSFAFKVAILYKNVNTL